MLTKLLYKFIQIAFTAILVYFIYSKLKNIDFKGVPYASMAVTFLPMLLLYFISKFFSLQRLFHIQLLNGISIPYHYHLRIYLIGMFYNIFLPGGIGGDAYKAYRMNQDFKSGIKLTGLVLVMDRAVGLMSILICYSLFFLLSQPVPIYYIILISMIYILYFLMLQKLSFTSALIEVYSLISQGLQIMIVYLMMYSLDIDLKETDYILLFLLSSIASMLPLSIGGLGIREATMLTGASFFQISSEHAVLIGFLFYIITILSSLPGLLMHIYKYVINVKDYAKNY